MWHPSPRKPRCSDPHTPPWRVVRASSNVHSILQPESEDELIGVSLLLQAGPSTSGQTSVTLQVVAAVAASHSCCWSWAGSATILTVLLFQAGPGSSVRTAGGLQQQMHAWGSSSGASQEALASMANSSRGLAAASKSQTPSAGSTTSAEAVDDSHWLSFDLLHKCWIQVSS